MVNQRWVNFNEAYDERNKLIAQFILEDTTILDLGCGNSSLKMYLPKGCKYQGCDIVKREESTIVCDFNLNEYPPIKQYDYVVCSGLIEYINDVPSFLNKLPLYAEQFIFSYAQKISSIEGRIEQDWVNHYTTAEFAELLVTLNYRIKFIETWKNQKIWHLDNLRIK